MLRGKGMVCKRRGSVKRLIELQKEVGQSEPES